MEYPIENVTVFSHPLIQHKISILRDKRTGTNEFRALIEEIAMLMGYEALRDLPLKEVEVETPIETCMTPMIAGNPRSRSFCQSRSHRSLPRRSHTRASRILLQASEPH